MRHFPDNRSPIFDLATPLCQPRPRICPGYYPRPPFFVTAQLFLCEKRWRLAGIRHRLGDEAVCTLQFARREIVTGEIAPTGRACTSPSWVRHARKPLLFLHALASFVRPLKFPVLSSPQTKRAWQSRQAFRLSRRTGAVGGSPETAIHHSPASRHAVALPRCQHFILALQFPSRH